MLIVFTDLLTYSVLLENSQLSAFLKFARQLSEGEVGMFIFPGVKFPQVVIYQKIIKSVYFHGVIQEIERGSVFRHCYDQT